MYGYLEKCPYSIPFLPFPSNARKNMTYGVKQAKAKYETITNGIIILETPYCPFLFPNSIQIYRYNKGIIFVVRSLVVSLLASVEIVCVGLH